MKLSFACESCGTSFNVSPELAGRPCRCKKCGHRFIIPQAEGAARELVGSGVGAVQSPPKIAAPPARPSGAPPRPAPPSAKPHVSQRALQTIQSQIALAPVSSDRIRAMQAQRFQDDFDVDDRAPYAFAEPINETKKKKKFKPGKAVKRAYSNELRKVQKWTRYLNELGLELTVPFFVLIPLGYILQKSWLAMTGFTGVLLINLARLALGLANVLIIPFRESPMQGVLFLVPPFTYTYSRKNWDKLQKPLGRVVSPLGFILLIFLMYVFLPSWFGHKPPQKPVSKDLSELKAQQMMEEQESGMKLPTVGDVKKKFEKGVENLKQDLGGQLKQAKELTDSEKLQEAGRKAATEINKAADKVQEQIDSLKGGTPPADPK